MHQNVKTFVADLEFTCIYTHTLWKRCMRSFTVITCQIRRADRAALKSSLAATQKGTVPLQLRLEE